MRILVVDDDPGALETFRRVLTPMGMRVHVVGAGTAAIDAARAGAYDLAIIDQRLPDISGLDVAKTLIHEHIRIPWILTSGWMDVDLAVEAMKLGAVRAVSLPFDVEAVVTKALAEACAAPGDWPDLPLAVHLPEARSVADRFAWIVLRGCDAPHDPRTIGSWAAAVAISRSVVTETCRLAGVRPHDARDFMRILRVLIRNRGSVRELNIELNVADHRTLKHLLDRSGIRGELKDISLAEFIRAQRFLRTDTPALSAVRCAMTRLPGICSSGEYHDEFSSR